MNRQPAQPAGQKAGNQAPTGLPDRDTLAAVLGQLLEIAGVGAGITFVDRDTNEHTSTFPSEVVTCRTREGRELCLHIKYSAGIDNSSYRHRGGVAYEAAVYSNIIEPFGMNTPVYYGHYHDQENGWNWLVIGHIDNAVTVNMSPSCEAMLEKAAAWIGRFHAACHTRHGAFPPNFLNVYDRDYYRGWLDRTLLFARRADLQLPMLDSLERHADKLLALLLEPEQTVLHGEFCPMNILATHRKIVPIDWESAAWGLGEIDLVALVDGWPEEAARRSGEAYRKARWPGGPPHGVAHNLDAARVYWNLRWLGESREALLRKSARVHLREIAAASARLGFI